VLSVYLKKLAIMTGLKAFNSHSPLLPATVMAVWLPMTCTQVK